MYDIKKGTFEKYQELRTKEYLETPFAKVMQKGDNYYIIEKNGEYLTEFLVYSDTNVLACPVPNVFLKAKLIKEIMEVIKQKEYTYIVTYVPVEDTQKIEYMDNTFIVMKRKIEQSGYQYFEYKVYL